MLVALLVAGILILLALYWVIQGRIKPTLNIKKFPRKYPNEKVGSSKDL